MLLLLSNRISQIEHDEIQQVTTSVRQKTKLHPKLGIICGSGLGGIANEIESPQIIPYAEIEGFPKCTGKNKQAHLVN